MNISDKLLRSFSEIINTKTDTTKRKQNVTVLGTVVKEGDNVSVKIDGSDISTPAKTLISVDHGDRVDVLIENHKATITANHTSPAITKVGAVYVTMSPDGIIVGKLDEDEQPTGASILIDPTSGDFKVVDADGNALAKFGLNAQIGRSDRPHSITTENAFQIIDSKGNVLATFSGNTSIKKLRSEQIDVIPPNGIDGNIAATAYDNNGNLVASTRLLASYATKRAGLYNSITNKWLIFSEPSGDIKASITQLSSERIDVIPQNGTDGNIVTTAYDNNGNLVASARLLASHATKRAGLYDSKTNKWLIFAEPSGDIKARITPIQLYSGIIHPQVISADDGKYTTVSVPGLSQWTMIAAYCRVGSNYQHLIFIRGGQPESYMTYYNRVSNVTTRGGFRVDWSNNRMQIRGLVGDDTDMIGLYYVYGILTL